MTCPRTDKDNFCACPEGQGCRTPSEWVDFELRTILNPASPFETVLSYAIVFKTQSDRTKFIEVRKNG